LAPHKLVIPLRRAASCFEDVAGAGARFREWTVVGGCRRDLLSVVAD